MARVRTARDFGLEDEVADAIAIRFDPLRDDLDQLSAALARAIIEREVVRLPEAIEE